MEKFIFLILAISASNFQVSAGTYPLPAVMFELTAVSTVNFVTKENEKAVTVRITGSIKDSMELRLCDDNGNILYSEIVQNKEVFTKKMILNELQFGTYHITVSRKLMKTIQPFELTKTGVQLNESERKDIFLPQIIQKGNEICVFCFSPFKTDMDIRIYDNEGVLLMKDVNSNVNEVNKRFSLSQFPTGAYFFEMNAGEEVTYLTVYYTAQKKQLSIKPNIAMH